MKMVMAIMALIEIWQLLWRQYRSRKPRNNGKLKLAAAYRPAAAWRRLRRMSMKASTLEKQQLKAMAAALAAWRQPETAAAWASMAKIISCIIENEKPNGSEGSKAMLKS
jgi:hypothetical protein